jgi:hypothetical protein
MTNSAAIGEIATSFETPSRSANFPMFPTNHFTRKSIWLVFPVSGAMHWKQGGFRAFRSIRVDAADFR